MDILFFREHLLHWSAQYPRPLPWKGERDAYKIWLSEIILQQTRVEQGLPYYERFVATYPTVKHLADASETALMKLWEGLGYYSRARNLHATAQYIAYELGGQFPESYEGIRSLKGVGDYTAAAIASFAYDLPFAVLDGNVYRVLSRYFGIDTPIDQPIAKKEFAHLVQQLLDTTRPAAWNQAMMDFGATWCTPRQPQCTNCPMQLHCSAFQQGVVSELPRKSKKLQRKTRIFLYAVIHLGEETFIKKRTAKDIWKNLYEFPMIELNTLPDNSEEAMLHLQKNFLADIPWGERKGLSLPSRQLLTHQEIISLFQEVYVSSENRDFFLKKCPSDWILVKQKEIKNTFAFPKTVDAYLRGGNQTFTLFF
jgi:A/G-specific adenine glycosylase